MRVYKYEIPVKDEMTIYMPKGAQVLHIECQGRTPYMWVLVDPNEAIVPHSFVLYGTGHFVPEQVGAHVGSFLHHDLRLVFHVFRAS